METFLVAGTKTYPKSIVRSELSSAGRFTGDGLQLLLLPTPAMLLHVVGTKPDGTVV